MKKKLIAFIETAPWRQQVIVVTVCVTLIMMLGAALAAGYGK